MGHWIPGSLASGLVDVWSLVYANNNKFLISGVFFGPPYFGPAMIRVQSDGSTDTGFTAATAPQSTVRAVVEQSDGKLLIGGKFVLTSGGTSFTNLARLNTNGTLDTSFSNKAAPDAVVNATAIAEDNSIWIGGDFTMVQGAPKAKLARLA